MMVPPAGTPGPELPAADADALEHSARVLGFVRELIASSGGWISFADYMNVVLYAPGLGYYAAGARKFGAAGDFVTAPELTPLFGRTLATSVASVLKETQADVIELGPGSGRLAADVLEALATLDLLPGRYRLLEVSPELRARQQTLLERRIPALMDRVEWIDALPRRWRGVVLANEVLDAVPPHVIVHAQDGWHERGVASGDEALVLEDQPIASSALLASAQQRFPASVPYVSELNPASEALVRSLAATCEQGALLLIDYGYPANEYYHRERSAGTVMAHYRHHAIADPLFLPGLCDITAHVDFSAIAEAGVDAGMEVAGFTTQAAFLLETGIADRLTAVSDPRSVDYLRAAAAVNRLVSPADMGERFKVLALEQGLASGVPGFARHDQSHRL